MSTFPKELEAALRLIERYCEQPEASNAPDALHQRLANLHNRIRKKRRAGLKTVAICKRCGQPKGSKGRICARCSEEEQHQRIRREDLSGRYALVTGGRIKIGRATALRLLRCGAHVTVTTRFSHAAAIGFSQEADFDAWQDRLTIHSVDFRQPSAVMALTEHLRAHLPHLDILVHNAAQTNRRPIESYEKHLRLEARPASCGAKLLGARFCDVLDFERSQRLLPEGLMHTLQAKDVGDFFGTDEEEPAPPDEKRSWMMELDDIPPVEFMEVLLINTATPFLLNRELRSLFDRAPFGDRYIVHVVGADGSFSAKGKSSRHVHINMSKAALNMLTRTTGSYYARAGIYVNSVDTGWVTDERPEASRGTVFRPTLDMEDAAARVCYPIFEGVSGRPSQGKLFRDFRPSAW